MKTNNTTTKKSAKAKKGKKPKKRSPRWVRWLLMGLTLFLGLCTVFSAYSGMISPDKSHGYSGVVQMTFPIWLLMLGVVSIFDLIWHRRAVFVSILSILVAWGPTMDIFPLHLFGRRASAAQLERSFTLLTFNVENFWVEEGARRSDGLNASLEFILDTDADIVCLQEGRYIQTSNATPITKEQRRRLHKQYPYVYTSAISQVILSKYPVEPIRLDFRSEAKGDGLMAAYRVRVEGEDITIFNVHLRSIGLTGDDVQLFHDLTQLRGSEDPKKVRTQLIDKLANANVMRAKQADKLVQYIKNLGGPNVIVCGDFNDIPGSYSIRRLEECGMRQVYPEVGFGPMITFHENRFFFRIDHVLYKGGLKPLKMKRPRIGSSDHYPLLTTFYLKDAD